MSKYKEWTEKSLVITFIFNLCDSVREQEELENELIQRGLSEWAEQMLLELFNIFDRKWKEREKNCLKKSKYE